MAGSSWEWKPRGVGDWLDGVFQLYRAHFKPLFGLSLAVLLPLGLLEGLAQRAVTRNAFVAMAQALQGEDPTELLTSMAAGSPGSSAGLIFLSVLATTFLYVAGVYMVNELLHGRSRSIGEVLNATPGYWARYLGMSLLLFLGYLLLTGVALGMSMGLSFALDARWIAVVGVIVWLPVVAFLAVRWLFASQSLVAERVGVTAAIRRSFRLTRGSFWSIVGRLLLYGLITYALRAALDLGVFMAAGAVALTRSTVAAVAFQGVVSLVGALLAPLTWIALTLIYYDLRIRKEGYDLQQVADSLEQQATPE
ncbi:MAG: glycerophosphoryl diester phosphodiesterase membrane domain-containing protein [Bacillota bacterium]